jgi:DNA-binding NarL/FixJ family response regulator
MPDLAIRPVIRVLLVDDHPVARAGVAAMLRSELDFHVVGEAGNETAALEAFRAMHPDIALVDVRLGDASGIDLVKALRTVDADARAVMLSSSDVGDDVRDAMDAGARGYLIKTAPAEAFYQALRAVHAGEIFLPAELGPALAEAREEAPLTSAERSVLTGLTRGLSNHDIARLIGRSDETVKLHLKSIFRKIGAANRTEAAMIATRRHLTE